MKKPLLTAIIFAGIALTATTQELPVSFTDRQIAEAVANAPELPVDLGFDLKLKLVDYVDFTAEEVLHDFRDRNSSKVVEGPAGKYRQTAAHRHAHFSVRWKSAGADRPHLLVFEYPDDADRQICFFMHDSRLSGKKNIDWSLEAGVNCGKPFPTSGTMQYHTMFFWPSDEYPVAMVMNWERNKSGAAASRLWVYAIEEDLPALAIDEPEPETPRMLGTLYNYALVPNLCVFGGKGPESAFSHMVDYHFFRGENLIAWPVVSNNSWGFRCTIPAWNGGDQWSVELDQALVACEKRGMKFLPIFNTGFEFKLDGKTDVKYDPAERRALIEKGFEQFMERYGKSPSLYGIAFDTQDLSPKYGEAALDQFRKSFGTLAEFRGFLRSIAPDLPVFHFLGGRSIHDQYFHDAGDVLHRWETSEDHPDWSAFLADEADSLWTSWNRDPDEMNADGIETILSYHADDARIFDTYYQNPRAAFYWDLEASADKANLINTRKAMVWNTFYEGHIGLTPSNWWYQKLWVAPDFNPAPPLTLYGHMMAMSHRDRDLLLVGSWNRKGSGMESSMRGFAQAFRALPPIELEPLAISGTNALIARSGIWKNKIYLNVINPAPFPQELVINGNMETVAPFNLLTRSFAEGTVLEISGTISEEYRAWVAGRLDQFSKMMDRLSDLPESYRLHLSRAQTLFDATDVLGADRALGFGLSQELETRLEILAPRPFEVPKVNRLPSRRDSLDRWPSKAADVRTDGSHIATHLFFPGQWDGQEDLSLRIRAAHDGKKLVLGIRVYDTDRTDRDGAALHFSSENYLKVEPQHVKYETTIRLAPPAGKEEKEITGPYRMKGTIRNVKGGYEAILFFDVSEMPLGENKQIGWSIVAEDDDPGSGSRNYSWARKQSVVFPNDPLYPFWDDARTCGELIFQ